VELKKVKRNKSLENNMNVDALKLLFKGKLIVSCQTFEGEPIHGEGIVVKMAQCAKWADAAGIRANHPQNVADIKAAVGLPVIGIWKVVKQGCDVYITPTMEAVDALVDAGSDIIALDATDRISHDGRKAYELIADIKKKYPDVPVMADISTFEEGVNAVEWGADFVGTTLSGYTEHSKKTDGPNFELIEKLCERFKDKVIAEGKVNCPEEAVRCIKLGAMCVVVGGAITRPHLTAARFVSFLKEVEEDA
jgi:N-acylglucosamine-6-phosphate 2-epimerase